MKRLLLIVVCCLTFQQGWCQQLIDVADLTLKLSAGETKDLYYTFDSNDQIVFGFEEVNLKPIKSLAIIEEASQSVKYEDYEVAQIKGKAISVYKRGIYKFRFVNASLLKGKVCKIKIQRQLAAGGRADFNTSVKWVEKADTTYNTYTKKVVTGQREYDVQRSRRVLARVDTSIVPVVNRVERVHSKTNLDRPNYSLINFSLPTNLAEPNVFLPYRTTEVVSWAYSVGVGESGQAWYKDANKKAGARAVANLTVQAGLATGGTGALAMLALEGVSLFSNPPNGDNCIFSVLFSQNGQNYILKNASGNSVAASGQITSLKQGSMTLKLENDNTIDAINVDVKIVACVITKIYQDEAYTVKKSEPIEELKTFKEPKIAMRKVPVMMD
ncbi:hypothetical protein ACFST9_14550 [Hymenobacter monticola]|uniref:DUF4139 domain-containing protein n=1 Tax=Hymenobacter monticola TaxID=1705399 RepID=A0ABY4BBY0_9BACT|nr:hypothetical protein [Hymenobacter monticola]UOE36668.1 hypothetical protein MTP16_25150 [Hymenobacter monticola]